MRTPRPPIVSRMPAKAGLLGVALVLAACGSSDGAALDESSPTPTSPGGGGSSGATAGEAPPPAEVEVESNFLAPVATQGFVWIANPKSGRVAYVNVSTLETSLAEAGNGPTYLTSVPGKADAALVLNVLSKDATLLSQEGGKLSSRSFPVAALANGWSISASGRWAIAWADYRRELMPAKTKGFQDLTLVDLSGKVAPVTLAVGYRPVSVNFAEDEREAYVVTQDGIAVVGLGDKPQLSRNLALSDNALEDPGSRDVSVTPNGAYAFIRRDNDANIGAIDLRSGVRTSIPMQGPVTDLDLAVDGKSMVAVVRSKSVVTVMQVPEIVNTPSAFREVTVAGQTIGSVSLSPSGTTALLYSNAVDAERLTILSVPTLGAPGGTDLAYRTIKLYSPVLSVFSSPDASHALVIHQKVSPGAFSLVPVKNTLPAKIVETQAAPTAVAFAGSSDRVVVAERDAKKYGCYVARLPEFSVERFALASPPVAVGIVGQAKRAYVSQEHPDGRITFIDLETGSARTLTGFELGARISDGSK
jgi:hypothetical protein